MDSSELTTKQARKMHDQLRPAAGYLARLKDRMYAERFPQDDEFFRLVIQAQDAMQSLMMKLHYMSCESGVAMTRRGK